MSTRRKKSKRGRGRPIIKPLPQLIPDSPENVMRAVLATPPKNTRRHQREATT